MSAPSAFEVPDGMDGTGAPFTSEVIAVGVDGSLASRAAVRWALGHARPGDTVELVHAWKPAASDPVNDPADDDALARRFGAHELAHARALRRDPAVELRVTVIEGDARECLSGLGARLLVVGASARHGVGGHRLGSVSGYLARHVSRPLVIVPCPTGRAPGRAPAGTSAGD
jgi:nucleotide-binding universal stress UspA family protein